MSNGILVFAEHRAGEFNKTAIEAVGAAQEIGAATSQPVIGVVLGSGFQDLAQKLAAYKLDKIVYADSDKLAEYTPDGYTNAMEALIRQHDPRFVIFPHTYLVRDFAPKLAARFGKGVISDCIRAESDSAGTKFARRIFLGKIDSEVIPGDEAPVFVTFQSGAYRGEQAIKADSPAQIEEVKADAGAIRMQPEAAFQQVKAAVDLSKADVIVAVGRGIKGQEHIALAERLAEALGGELAASRPICDAGWLPIERQIGSSGQVVAPKLYVALGISGAIQHLVGMKNSTTIVAVNKDPEAPIFDIADYGIVGDIFEVVPALIESVNKAKG